ncbi:restriction endonuclease subunit S [Rhizobium laguerreae]|uniref:restriction endonuclease subunit S n=1 Tax=Rhizobium laguerreae TaxID=1076926 RepID=UPI00147956B8|nr:restriction endonuclease subunit S [Rhizobium laguerreae]NNH79694.1 restriction endonuclease subunit S [Rhizobium laguerreae]
MFANQRYTQIGLRSHGRGIFIKEPVEGWELGDKRVFEVEPNCLVLNIVFAWEQAVGRTDESHAGLIASHRFPMYRPKENLCDIEFLRYFFLTPHGKHLLGLASPGGAGRNKTLGQKEFERLAIALPPLAEQKSIAEILSTWDKAINTAEKLLANAEAQKRALMQQLLTGRRRLRGFEGSEWVERDFATTFKVDNDKSSQVPKPQYLTNGEIPIVDQGREFIAGFTDQQSRYVRVPAIIFGDHTKVLKWVDFAFCPGADGVQVLKARSSTDIRFGYYLLQATPLPDLGYSRHMRELKKVKFKMPISIDEQRSIAQLFAHTDRVLEHHKAQLSTLGLEKRALMQQLLTGRRRVIV